HKKPKYVMYALFTLWLLAFHLYGFAQQKKITYYPGEKLTLVGKAMETVNPYHRVDTALYPDLPKNVTNRLKQSAGLAISFKTNSQAIYVKWCTASEVPSASMADIAYRGFDLYIRENGAWQYAGVARPKINSTCAATTVAQDMDSREKECLL